MVMIVTCILFRLLYCTVTVW